MQDDKERRLKKIGGRLREFRKKLGYKSQETFASELGMKRSAYSHYELGESEPTGAFFHNLSERFGADINYILTGKSEQELPDLDAYLSRMGVDEMMKTIIKGYMSLPDSKRRIVKEYIESLAAEITANAAHEPPDAIAAPGVSPATEPPVSESDTPPASDLPPAPEYHTPDGVPLDPTIEAEVAKYRARRYAQEKTRRMCTTSPDSASSATNE